MSEWSKVHVDEAEDIFGGKYPGAMKFLGPALGAEQMALTWRHMPPGAGGRGTYGHSHKTQEELYFVAAGTLTFKVGEDEFTAPAGTAVRMAPEAVRSVHNDGDEDVVLLLMSPPVDDLRAEIDRHGDFWD